MQESDSGNRSNTWIYLDDGRLLAHKGDGPKGPPFSLINDTLINDGPLVDSRTNIPNIGPLIPLKLDGISNFKSN